MLASAPEQWSLARLPGTPNSVNRLASGPAPLTTGTRGLVRRWKRFAESLMDTRDGGLAQTQVAGLVISALLCRDRYHVRPGPLLACESRRISN
ncbi:MAG: hypothetical protein WAS07_03080 [Micropruina sp.]